MNNDNIGDYDADQQQQQHPPVQLIFTVTAGRSGTTLLTRLFELVPVVVAKHEPKPSFVNVMRLVQNAHTYHYSQTQTQKNKEEVVATATATATTIATHFLLETKIPLILQQIESEQSHNERQQLITHYVETSHLFCKGFIEPIRQILLQQQSMSLLSSSLERTRKTTHPYTLHKTLNLIILRRHPSLIARSLLQRNAIPGRSRWGKKYLLHPNDWKVLGATDKNNGSIGNNNNVRRLRWISLLKQWSNYQLCYWYALEIERRQLQYRKMAAESPTTINCYTITIEEVTNFDKFCDMCTYFGIELPTTGNVTTTTTTTAGTTKSARKGNSFREQFEKIAKHIHNPNVKNPSDQKKNCPSSPCSLPSSQVLKEEQPQHQFVQEEKEIWEWIQQSVSSETYSELIDYQLPPLPPTFS